MNTGKRVLGIGAATVLASVSALHVAWGLGSSWPMRDRRLLAEAVAGIPELPSPRACFTVAGALTGAATVVAGAGGEHRLARGARAVVASGLMFRGLTGVTGMTGMLVGWTPSAHFAELDRRWYGPLCLGIGAAIAGSLTRSPSGRRSGSGRRRSSPYPR